MTLPSLINPRYDFALRLPSCLIKGTPFKFVYGQHWLRFINKRSTVKGVYKHRTA